MFCKSKSGAASSILQHDAASTKRDIRYTVSIVKAHTPYDMRPCAYLAAQEGTTCAMVGMHRNALRSKMQVETRDKHHRLLEMMFLLIKAFVSLIIIYASGQIVAPHNASA